MSPATAQSLTAPTARGDAPAAPRSAPRRSLLVALVVALLIAGVVAAAALTPSSSPSDRSGSPAAASHFGGRLVVPGPGRGVLPPQAPTARR